MPKLETTQCKYEEGKNYTFKDEEPIDVEARLNNEDKFLACQIVLLAGYFVLAQNHRIELKAGYEEVLLFGDKSDPRKLLLKY
jgi:hypothetical protein